MLHTVQIQMTVMILQLIILITAVQIGLEIKQISKQCSQAASHGVLICSCHVLTSTVHY